MNKFINIWRQPKVLILVGIVVIVALAFFFKPQEEQPEDHSEIVFHAVNTTTDWSIPLEVNGKEEWEYFTPSFYSPTKLFWDWEGEELFYFQIDFTDGNQIIYSLENTTKPKVQNNTFIDERGIPKIRIPKIIKLTNGETQVSLVDDYKKYFGSGTAVVQSIRLVGENAVLHDFEVLEWQEITTEQQLLQMNKKLLITLEAPYGNTGTSYLIKDDEMTIQISSRFMLSQTQPATLLIEASPEIDVTSFEQANVQKNESGQYVVNFEAKRGYDEKNIYLSLQPKDFAKSAIKITFATEELTETVEYSLEHLAKDALTNHLKMINEGVYPVGLESDERQEIRRQLQNHIKLREPIRDTFRQFIGKKESVTYPAGVVAATLKNTSSYDLPLLIQYQVLDEDGNEIKAFRGEQWAKEIGGDESVPEAVIQVKQNETYEWRAPLYADILHLQEGTYNTRLTIKLFGTDTVISMKEWTIEVHKERAFQQLISVIGLVLAALCVVIFIWKQKKWLAFLTTKELILIALIAAVKFAVVDVPWFVLGDSIEALLGPLGPFVQLGKGIFSDILQALFMIVLIMLVPKPGVVVISAVVRIILSAVAFGSFNPITSMLMLSYALIVDSLLLAGGFTNGKQKIEPTFKVLTILLIIFAFQHAYSTYTYYYVWMFLYRLFYPDWYIHLNACISIIYASLGIIIGVFLGRHLRKVID